MTNINLKNQCSAKQIKTKIQLQLLKNKLLTSKSTSFEKNTIIFEFFCIFPSCHRLSCVCIFINSVCRSIPINMQKHCMSIKLEQEVTVYGFGNISNVLDRQLRVQYVRNSPQIIMSMLLASILCCKPFYLYFVN